VLGQRFAICRSGLLTSTPIELPYSKFKALLREVAARTVLSLFKAIRSFAPLLKNAPITPDMPVVLSYDRCPL
jgi:hypothetical protein